MLCFEHSNRGSNPRRGTRCADQRSTPGSSNGRTAGSGPANRGSSPCPGTTPCPPARTPRLYRSEVGSTPTRGFSSCRVMKRNHGWPLTSFSGFESRPYSYGPHGRGDGPITTAGSTVTIYDLTAERRTWKRQSLNWPNGSNCSTEMGMMTCPTHLGGAMASSSMPI